MTIEIHLPEELVELVDEKARTAGLGREAYVQNVISREVMASISNGEAPRLQRAERDLQESKWLAENGKAYAGKWVALEGQCLLASGATAKEVFAKVADRSAPPLVIRIDENELPFAGW